ncbi:MAG: hypothetical protein ACYDAG_03180 [Chloroflexota bacterium]
MRKDHGLLHPETKRVDHSLSALEAHAGAPRGLIALHLVNFTDGLITELQRILEAKCTMAFAQPTYLILDTTKAALTVADEGPDLVRELRIPSRNPFVGIFLALTANGTSTTEFFALENATAN